MNLLWRKIWNRTPRYTYSELESAAIAWESVLDFISVESQNGGGYWTHAAADHGMAALREIVLNMGIEIEAGYVAHNGESRYDTCFDWEFMPRVMAELPIDSTAAEIQNACAAEIARYEKETRS